jgi:hypothetical protein
MRPDLLAALVIQLLTQVDAPTGSGIAWRAGTDIGCPTVSQLEAAYLAHVRSLPASDRPEDRGDVSVEVTRPSRDSIQVRFAVAKPLLAMDRVLPASSTHCTDVAHTIAILVSAWLLELRESTDEAPAPPPTTPEVPAVAALEVVVGSARPPSHHVQLSLEVGGDALVGQSPSLVGGIYVGAELRASSVIGVGLQASWFGNLSVPDSPYGSILIHRQTYLAYLATSIPPLKRLLGEALNVRPFVGPVLAHFAAQSYGYETTLQEDQFVPGLQAGGLVDLELVGPVFLLADFSALILAQSISYTVSRAQGPSVSVANVASASFAASLGLGFRLF